MNLEDKICITKIKWDRIWIYFTIKGLPTSTDVYIMNLDQSYTAKLIPADKTNGIFKLNITNPGNCNMLPVGIYYLGYKVQTSHGFHLIKKSDIENIKYSNRRFIYFHKERAYRIQFSNKDDFKMRASDAQIPIYNPSKRLLSSIRKRRNDLAKDILRAIYNMEYRIFHRSYNDGTIKINNTEVGSNIFNLKRPHILLMSDQSEQMGSNMLALKEALIREGYKPKEALRAITTKHYTLFNWIRTLKKIAKADFIFLDDHSQTTDWLTIKGAVITQLWHAGAGFKATGYARFGMPASPAPTSGHRQYTYGIAGSKKIRHFFSEVWGINDEMVLPAGMPRLDKYLDEDYRNATTEKLLNEYPVLRKFYESDKKKIILFAPTYRGENKKAAYYPYDKLDIDSLYDLCTHEDAVILFKMHPFVTEPVPIPEGYRNRLIDLSDYNEINDLFYITDLLITDYSSNIYEFSLMRKPMLFYAFDIDSYSKERGFHRDYRTNVPGKVVETFDAMIDAIISDNYEYDRVEEYIKNNFEYIDSNACQRIIDWIIRGKLPYDI